VCGEFCRSLERRNLRPGKDHRTSGLVLQRILQPLWTLCRPRLMTIASFSDCSVSSQFLWSCPVNCAIMVLTVLFARSVGFSCGVYGAVNCCLIPISARKPLKMLMTTFGTPYLAIICSLNAFLSDSAVALRRGDQQNLVPELRSW